MIITALIGTVGKKSIEALDINTLEHREKKKAKFLQSEIPSSG